jgi:ribosomal protein L11 methyltransferase
VPEGTASLFIEESFVPLVRLSVAPSAPGYRDAVCAAMFGAGALGLQENGDELVTVLTSSPEDAALLDRLIGAVRGADAESTVQIGELPDVDWSSAWRSRIGAHELGVLAIVPPWLADGREPSHTIVIEPQMAFGTGEHETTRCVVRLMQGVIRPGDTVADLGAGSAVLSIAAAKLGATRVAAIEMDADAIPNAELNVVRNDASGTVTVIEGDAMLLLPLVAPVRVVLANILSSVLMEMLPAIAAALPAAGVAILSGILLAERQVVLDAVAAGGGWTVSKEEAEGEWWAVVIRRDGTVDGDGKP